MFSPWHMKYFRDAVDRKSLIGAARQNHVTPSAVSQAIKALEASLGVELLRHGKNQFHLSDQGRALYNGSGEILLRMERLRSEILESGGTPSGNLSFATQHSVATTFLPDALVTTKRLYPQLTANFMTQTREGVRDLVLQRQIEFAISVDNVDFPGLEKVELGSGEFGCFLHKSIPFSKDLPWLLAGDTNETNRLRDAYKKLFKTDMRSEYEAKSWTVIKELTLKGLGIGFMPCYVVSPEERKQLQKISRIGVDLPYKICVYYLKQLPLSRNALAFIEVVQNVLPKSMSPTRL